MRRVRHPRRPDRRDVRELSSGGWTLMEATMRTATVELPGGKHLRVTRVEGDGRDVLALTRSYRGGVGDLLEPEAPQLVLPASTLPDLRAALAELEG